MEQYIFAPTACEAGLEEELAAALEKRMEIFSRASLPGMWKKTDALNRYAARGSGRKGVLRKILPWVLILAGLFLTIPGLMEPKELRTPLIGHFKPSAAAPCAEERLVPPSGGWNAAKYERPCGSERAGRF